MEYNELDIRPEILSRMKEHGFKEFTPIQEKAIDIILDGRDVIGQAETGSGKTLAFVLPILHRIMANRKLQALILTPTRELCVQITDVFHDFGDILGVKTTAIYGGVDVKSQIEQLQNAHIVVATPGRLLDHINRRTVNLDSIRFLVLDEADRMLDMGFIYDVEKILSYTPIERQTLLFSATITQKIRNMAERHMKNPFFIRTGSLIEEDKLKQVYYDIYRQNDKFSLLVHLLKNHSSGLSIVFCGTRKETDNVVENLRKQKINALGIHGGLSQNKRLKTLNLLKRQKIDVLVATDVAARGLDIDNITHVYNYDVPKTSKEYIHRVGRTARAGKKGVAVTLLTRRDYDNFRRVQSDEKLLIQPAEFPKFERVAFFRNQRRTTERGKKHGFNIQRRRRC